MNDPCYEYSEDGVYLNSFDCVFVHKEVRYTNKTEKNRLQYTNKKLSPPGNYIYISRLSNELETVPFLYFVFLRLYLCEAARTTIS